jgi:plasmid stabilization system protein ParE
MYDVIYLPTAKRELEEAALYIAVELSAPDAALALVDAVDEAVQKLAYMPYRHPIYHAMYGLGSEVRLLPVKNYNIFYVVDEEQQTVEIWRILYGRRTASEE